MIRGAFLSLLVLLGIVGLGRPVQAQSSDEEALLQTLKTFFDGGEDAFQLFRSTEGWRIIAVADTQRREGCAARE